MLISTTGVATAGKDEFCNALVRNHNFVKVGWSDPLCEMALAINPLLYCGWFRWHRLAYIVKRRGWTDAKRIPAVRQYLQWLGTDVVRKILGEDTWINASVPRIQKLMREKKNVAITNTRFENEAKAIERLGGTLILIERPGFGPVNDHISDQGLAFSHASVKVINDGTLSDLEYSAEEVIADMEATDDAIDAEASIIHFERIVDRGLVCATEFILAVSAPEHCDMRSFATRNAASISRDTDSDEEVYVISIGGQEAGVITYADGMLVAEVTLTR